MEMSCAPVVSLSTQTTVLLTSTTTVIVGGSKFRLVFAPTLSGIITTTPLGTAGTVTTLPEDGGE